MTLPGAATNADGRGLGGSPSSDRLRDGERSTVTVSSTVFIPIASQQLTLITIAGPNSLPLSGRYDGHPQTPWIEFLRQTSKIPPAARRRLIDLTVRKEEGRPEERSGSLALAQCGHCGRRRQQRQHHHGLWDNGAHRRRVSVSRARVASITSSIAIRGITTRRKIHSAGCVPIVRKRNNGPTRLVVVGCFGDWRI
jgi:hypothetical protein